MINRALKVGQSQSTIISHVRNYGQAAATIASGLTSAQAQADVKRKTRAFGQARAFVQATVGTDYLFTDEFGSANLVDFTGYNDTIPVDMTTWGYNADDPDPRYSGEHPANGTWFDSFSGGANGWLRFTLSTSTVITISTREFEDNNHDTVLGIYTGDSTYGAWTVLQVMMTFLDTKASYL
jgi:hypothetical protein